MTMFVAAKNGRVPKGHLELASEMMPYTLLTEQGNDYCLKFVVERQIMRDWWESIVSTGKKETCVQ